MKMIIIENPNLNHNNENNIQIDINKPNDINNFVNISDLNTNNYNKITVFL